jgi:hypothetical protein
MMRPRSLVRPAPVSTNDRGCATLVRSNRHGDGQGFCLRRGRTRTRRFFWERRHDGASGR